MASNSFFILCSTLLFIKDVFIDVARSAIFDGRFDDIPLNTPRYRPWQMPTDLVGFPTSHPSSPSPLNSLGEAVAIIITCVSEML